MHIPLESHRKDGPDKSLSNHQCLTLSVLNISLLSDCSQVLQGLTGKSLYLTNLFTFFSCFLHAWIWDKCKTMQAQAQVRKFEKIRWCIIESYWDIQPIPPTSPLPNLTGWEGIFKLEKSSLVKVNHFIAVQLCLYSSAVTSPGEFHMLNFVLLSHLRIKIPF